METVVCPEMLDQKHNSGAGHGVSSISLLRLHFLWYTPLLDNSLNDSTWSGCDLLTAEVLKVCAMDPLCSLAADYGRSLVEKNRWILSFQTREEASGSTKKLIFTSEV